MNDFKWNSTKSLRLKQARGVSFEEIVKSKLIEVLENPTRREQVYLLFWLKGYAWVVPAVEELGYIFLKTLYPSRKYTKKYKDKMK